MAKLRKKRTARCASATATGRKQSAQERAFLKLNEEIAAWHEMDPTEELAHDRS